MKLVTIIGARPQFIKASVVSKAIKDNNLNEIIICCLECSDVVVGFGNISMAKKFGCRKEIGLRAIVNLVAWF